MGRKVFSSTIIAVITIAVVGVVWNVVNTKNTDNTQPIYRTESTLTSNYYYPHQFNQALALAETLEKSFSGTDIQGGIIPHDITHGEYIAHFFQNLQDQNPEYILLIGPNHYEHGSTPLITSSANWTTQSGTLETASDIVNELLTYGSFSESNDIIENEHTISGIVPYFSYFLPETKLIPLIFKAEVTLYEIDLLIELLENVLPENTVIVAAVDFSHYLTSGEATENDKVTAEALQSLDYQTLLSFGPRFNDYLDSPPSIAFLLRWLEKHNITESTILYNTNSGLLANNPNQPTTSYFEVIYY